jgi:hypothetical protein
MRGTNVLYEQPDPREPGQKGAPAKHGAKFQLSSPPRAAEQDETFVLGRQSVHVQAWSGLHLRKLPDLLVMLLKVEFLKADGQPCYKRSCGCVPWPIGNCCSSIPSICLAPWKNSFWNIFAISSGE